MSETISLYLDLEPGQSADLEVVARAALSWATAVREMATHIDPMCEVRLELINGTKSSLSLNACLDLVRSAAPSRKTIKTLLIGVLLWLGRHPFDWAYDQVLDAVKAHLEDRDAPASDAEARVIADQVVSLLKPSVAGEAKRQMFRELERDPAIRGVGASREPGARPARIIPRSEFPARLSGTDVAAEGDLRRTVTAEYDVVLVSPVLKDAERRWRFQHGALPEFGATMRDHEFLEDLKTGRIAVPMRPGLKMRIEIQSKEENIGGVWEVKERAVSRVIEPSDRGQPQFLLPAEQ
ncbi:MAG: hypothetical protein PGN09_07755 [Sphingomonas fennica]